MGKAETRQGRGPRRTDLDIIFNGRPFAYYQAPDASGGLSLETLVRGAEERGYRLVYETRPRPFRMVKFERISQDAGER
jgi:hypothetical protein